MLRQRKRQKRLKAGDIVLICSPYVLVTHRGIIKNCHNPESYSVTGTIVTGGSSGVMEIPYDTRALLVDPVRPLVMLDGLLVMVPRNCLRRYEDE